MSRREWQDIFEEVTGELVEDYGDDWIIEFDDTIEAYKPARDWYQYIRGAFARFRCSKCGKTWPSRRVLVVFHFRLSRKSRRGTVKFRPFRQECRTCRDAEMEKPKFAPDNIEALLQKVEERIRVRCYRENWDDGHVPLRPVGRSEGPHEAAHCEACRRGVCRQSE
ncbi:receptor-transporting protein 3-like [Engraulis encrasicolus]|uniref:receptor-transporting protein 3-like n=1 Tax=Engraulis encrasicolus TaxID=184585 RepID=UPI002FCE7880